MIDRVRVGATLAGLVVLLVGALFMLPTVVHVYRLPNEISLPLLAIAGVLVLLGALALVSVAFSLMNLSDRAEALALPSGSIRAVIALSLVVLFAILAVFLFSSLDNGGRVQKLSCLDAAEKNRFVDNLGPQQILLTLETTGEPCPGKEATAAGPPGPAASTTPGPAASRGSVSTFWNFLHRLL
jgi:hypothetical protein